MKPTFIIALLALCLCAAGCGKGPAVVTMADSNKTEEAAEELKPLPNDMPSLKPSIPVKQEKERAFVRRIPVKQEKGKKEHWFKEHLFRMHIGGGIQLIRVPDENTWSEKELEELVSMGKSGDVTAMRLLGVLFSNHKSYLKWEDKDKALEWYRKAAEKGDTEAMVFTGHLFFEGKGVIQHDKWAFEWYKKADPWSENGGRHIVY